MAQESYPVVEKPVSAAQWSTMARAGGDGIIDRGNYPFWPGTVNSANNTIVLQPSRYKTASAPTSGAQVAEAALSGFYYRLTSNETLTVPAVSSTTTYRIALCYDPLREAEIGGPIRLGVFAGNLDKTQGKTYLVLWQLERKANQTLLDAWNATKQARRCWIAPNITVSEVADLPTDSETLVDTRAYVRVTGETWRAAVSATGEVSWALIAQPVNPDVAAATWDATPNTLVRRYDNGSFRVQTGTNPQDATNVQWVRDLVANSSPSASTGANPGLMARNTDGQTSVGDGTATIHAVNKRQLDAAIATRTPYGHGHNGGDISKTGTDVPWEVITGSTKAYTTTSGGSTWATLAVASNGRFFRYTSALKYKKNIRPYRPDVQDALAIEPVLYDSKATGLKDYIGVVADSYVETFPNLVQYGEDGEVEGWHYQLWPVVQQAVLRDLDRRDKEKDARIEALEQTVAELSARLDKIEGK